MAETNTGIICSRKVYFYSPEDVDAFIARYEKYITAPKKKVEGFSTLTNGGLYKILPEEKIKNAIKLYPLKFYMRSKDFQDFVEPQCDYRRVLTINSYVYNPDSFKKGECLMADCIYRSDYGKCLLNRDANINCVKAHHSKYVRRLSCGYREHEEPVHTSSGVRFGW